MISFRPLMNSARFLHRESIAYARATSPGRERSSCLRRVAPFGSQTREVNGGKGGRVAEVAVVIFLLLERPSTPLANKTFPAFFNFTKHKSSYATVTNRAGAGTELV